MYKNKENFYIDQSVYDKLNSIKSYTMDFQNILSNSSLISIKKQLETFSYIASHTYEDSFLLSSEIKDAILGTTLSSINECYNELPHMLQDLIDQLTSYTSSSMYVWTTKILETYQSSGLGELKNSIDKIPMYILDEITKMDFSSIVAEISISDDGALSYQNVTYERNEIPQELERQVQEVRGKDIPKQLEELKQNHWLLCFIIYILFLIPSTVETTAWYADVGQSIYEAVMDIPQMCYTIKEKSYIRNKANAKSDILTILVYDTKLEILEDIPRWYKVKYIDETGTEIEGWISKISVEE